VASAERERLHRDRQLAARGVAVARERPAVTWSRAAVVATPPLPAPPELELGPPTSWLRRRWP